MSAEVARRDWVAAVAGTLFLLFGMVVLGVSGARAASWSIHSTANAEGAEHSALYDIACEPASTSVCIAVGKKTISGVNSAYAQGWNGASWANQSAPAPVGATASELQSAHCLSKTSCVAAGSYTNVSGTFSLAESWNGSTWAIQTTPNPAGATETQLRGASCKVVTACMAVGSSVKSGVRSALAMVGNSGSWSLKSVPAPAETTASELNGVECNSATSCVAVGRYYVNASTYWAMAVLWNGTEWTLQTIPKPSGAKRSVLLDVSCSDASYCTAVGAYTNASSVQVSFAVRWNGAEWTHQATPSPAGSSNTVLQNVACIDRYSCAAVGDWLNSGTWQPMALWWNSAGWSLDAAGNPPGSTFGLLEGVSCRTTCLSVGWYTDAKAQNKTLGETREIPTWSQQSVPEASTVSRLAGVSCLAGPACVAVGFEQGAKDVARTFTWNGAAWSASGKPVPGGASQSRLSDVSCSSASECTAVGYFINSEGDEKPYAARFAKGSWTVQSIPLPGGATIGRLHDVSCTGSASCRAVGGYGFHTGTMALVWNGTAWSIEATPAGGDELRSISCISGSSCLAVGNESSNDDLVVKWNGASWSAVSDPSNALVLNGVSCNGASDCTVVGWGEGGYPFASHWNGSTWAQLPEAPRLAFSAFSHFDDVSCASASSCYAVGDLNAGPGFLAAKWDGLSWTLHDVPNPSSGYLAGVSCLSSTVCHAVGSTDTEAVAESFP